MSRSSWDKAPSWAKWRARDASGVLHFFSEKPIAVPEYGIWHSEGGWSCIADNNVGHWQQSLQGIQDAE